MPKHGHTVSSWGSPTYLSWKGMRARCADPKHKSFKHYGARGISVCERWDVFENFLSDMGERPDGMSIDRMDTNGNYDSENCKWSTRIEQNNNKNPRHNGLTEALVQEIHGRCEHGESQVSVSERLGIAETTVSKIRLGRRWPGTINGQLA